MTKVLVVSQMFVEGMVIVKGFNVHFDTCQWQTFLDLPPWVHVPWLLFNVRGIIRKCADLWCGNLEKIDMIIEKHLVIVILLFHEDIAVIGRKSIEKKIILEVFIQLHEKLKAILQCLLCHAVSLL